MNKRQRKKKLRNTLTRPYIMVCGSPWGIGIYKHGDDDHYGFPPTDMNPYEFVPDATSCSEREIAAWTEAKRVWDERS